MSTAFGETSPVVSVVIPMLNESSTARELLDRLDSVLVGRAEEFEIVLVDDGSSPAEAAMLDTVTAGRPRTRLLRLPRNFGQVVALAIGMDRARGDVVVTMDGDLQDPPEEVPKLLAAIDQGADVASASRDRLHGAAWRRGGSRLMTRLTSRIVGVAIADYGGQFNAYSAPVTRTMLSQWQPRTPILPLACSLASTVVEVPVTCQPRAAGRSRHGLVMKLGIVLDLFVGLPTARRFIRPVAVGTGAAATVAAAVLTTHRPTLRPVVMIVAAAALGAVAVAMRRYQRPLDDLRQLARAGETLALER